jgi:hypothetical protein
MWLWILLYHVSLFLATEQLNKNYFDLCPILSVTSSFIPVTSSLTPVTSSLILVTSSTFLSLSPSFLSLSPSHCPQGASTLSLSLGSESSKALAKCLFDLCNVLRHAGFTVDEMFKGFDRCVCVRACV